MFMYTKHSSLVDLDASGTKASTKHLESRLQVIQGHAFWVTEKPTRYCILLYNNVASRAGNFEGNPFSRTPLSFSTPCLRNPGEYSHKPYISRN